MWKLLVTKTAINDLEKIEKIGLKNKLAKMLDNLKINPYYSPPSYEKLRGDLAGLCSRRINIKHRLVYQVYEEEKVVKIIRAWSHYE